MERVLNGRDIAGGYKRIEKFSVAVEVGYWDTEFLKFLSDRTRRKSFVRTHVISNLVK